MSMLREADGFGNRLGQNLESWGNNLINKSNEYVSFNRFQQVVGNLDMAIILGIAGTIALTIRDSLVANSLDSNSAREVMRGIADTEARIGIGGLLSLLPINLGYRALEHRTHGSIDLLDREREDKNIPIPISTTVLPLLGRGLVRMGQGLR